MISKTISVCSAKDLSTWIISSKYIIKNIISNEYVVIVPESDVEIFQKYSPNQYRVLNESVLIGSFFDDLRNKFREDNSYRFGWYLQQFIKLAALGTAKDNELYLIWDADTVPLKRLNFTINEKVGYYYGIENHLPYFNLILSVTGHSKIVNYSFIAQCFAIKGSWFREFKINLETRHRSLWWRALIDNIDFSEPSGFSEYEILGTFLTHTHPDELFLIEKKWLRRGNSLIGDVRNIERKLSKLLLTPYDFVSFEGWDKPSITSRKNALVSCIKDLLDGS
jgi:Family of unknown function (DUF6492)